LHTRGLDHGRNITIVVKKRSYRPKYFLMYRGGNTKLYRSGGFGGVVVMVTIFIMVVRLHGYSPDTFLVLRSLSLHVDSRVD
jgi:hypothetical protein